MPTFPFDETQPQPGTAIVSELMRQKFRDLLYGDGYEEDASENVIAYGTGGLVRPRLAASSPGLEWFGGTGPSDATRGLRVAGVARSQLAAPLHNVQVATGGQTVFTLPWAYVLANFSLQVFRNGMLQTVGAGADYVETDTTHVTFNAPLAGGERITFHVA